jgi:hypothetical protein
MQVNQPKMLRFDKFKNTMLHHAHIMLHYRY